MTTNTETLCPKADCQRYIVVAWTFTPLLVNDVEIDGADVVVGIYDGKNADEAKCRAARVSRIPAEQLEAYRILS